MGVWPLVVEGSCLIIKLQNMPQDISPSAVVVVIAVVCFSLTDIDGAEVGSTAGMAIQTNNTQSQALATFGAC